MIETVKELRTIKLSNGNTYKVTFEFKNTKLSDKEIFEKETEILNKPITMLVSLSFDGDVEKVLPMVNFEKIDVSWLKPRDKGRPSAIICDSKGDAFCTVAVYEKEKEFTIFEDIHNACGCF
jgi:transposase